MLSTRYVSKLSRCDPFPSQPAPSFGARSPNPSPGDPVPGTPSHQQIPPTTTIPASACPPDSTVNWQDPVKPRPRRWDGKKGKVYVKKRGVCGVIIDERKVKGKGGWVGDAMREARRPELHVWGRGDMEL